jgi:protease II
MHYLNSCPRFLYKLRSNPTFVASRDTLFVFTINLESGHFSASDRYYYKCERDFELAWIHDHLGAPFARIAG